MFGGYKLLPKDIVIGTCGFCGGQVVAGLAGNVGGNFFPGLRDGARCVNCKAHPLPMPMEHRRKSERKVKP